MKLLMTAPLPGVAALSTPQPGCSSSRAGQRRRAFFPDLFNKPCMIGEAQRGQSLFPKIFYIG